MLGTVCSLSAFEPRRPSDGSGGGGGSPEQPPALRHHNPTGLSAGALESLHKHRASRLAATTAVGHPMAGGTRAGGFTTSPDANGSTSSASPHSTGAASSHTSNSAAAAVPAQPSAAEYAAGGDDADPDPNLTTRQWAARHRGSKNTACERCVRQKSKCVYRDESGACERCVSSRKECKAPPGRTIIPRQSAISSHQRSPQRETGELQGSDDATYPRKRVEHPEPQDEGDRSRQKLRYDELEEKVNRLYGLLEQSRSANENHSTATTAQPQCTAKLPTRPAVHGPFDYHETADVSDAVALDALGGAPVATAMIGNGTCAERPIESTLGRVLWEKLKPHGWQAGINEEMMDVFSNLTMNKGRLTLLKFKSMSEAFPFVICDHDPLDFYGLVTTKPFLAFGILTVTWSSFAAQKYAMFVLFREIMAIRGVARGERSLDLLQGGLVIIAWCHHYMGRFSSGMSMLMTVTSALATDLMKIVGWQRRHPFLERAGLDSEAAVKDLHRAYLGCYYVCVSVQKLVQSTNYLIKMTDDMLVRCWEFGENPDTPTDTMIPVLVELVSLAEEARDQLQVAEDVRSGDKASMRIIRRRMRQRLAGIEAKIGDMQVGRLTMDLLSHLVAMYISEPVILSLAAMPSGSIETSAPSEYQMQLLWESRSAALMFIKGLANTSEDEFRSVNVGIWGEGLGVLIQLSRIASPDGAVPEEAIAKGELRRELEAALDAMVAHFGAFCEDCKEGDIGPQILYWFTSLSRALKSLMYHGSQKHLTGKTLYELTIHLNENGVALGESEKRESMPIQAPFQDPALGAEIFGNSIDPYADVMANLSWDDLLGNLNVFQAF